ncbi:MAG: phosphate acyltransferase PlsX [Clostridia bacterium]|nr:phosphate acyltransferase PlsX [Clostridia bacterium]
MVKIVIDAMGGDFAPKQQVLGCVDALKKDKDLYLILCGDKEQIEAELAPLQYDKARLEIRHTTQTISMEETPTIAVKTKRDSSLVVAFELLKAGEADGLVSSGSTGAVLTAGILKLGRIKGVSRPGLCPAVPNNRGTATYICDCGANLECKPVNLVHFAIMASAYAQCAGVKNPKVGLLNNGTEDHKGLMLQQETNAILKTVDCINYAGNVEGRELMYGDIDVMVSDGFTGNIATKAVEGCGKAVSAILKREYKRNIFTKICALLSGGVIKNIRKGLDYEAIGGAVFLGLTKAVVKGHGNSKAKGFAACIAQATAAVREDLVGKIKGMLDSVDLDGATAKANEVHQ